MQRRNRILGQGLRARVVSVFSALPPLKRVEFPDARAKKQKIEEN